MLTVGALLQYGKYQVNDVLAVKGSNVTYRATQRDRDQSVVIKTVVTEYLAADIGIGRFLAEARRLAQLQHPHMVRVADCFVENSRLFLVTDFLSGQTLAQKIGQGPVAISDALRYIHQIGQAIALMHQQGLLHRDIKPSNIMLSDDQSSATLIDFNIARSLLDRATPSASDPIQSAPNSLSNGFTAPEPSLSPHLWTVAADIYGLAATLYALVTGKSPATAQHSTKNGTHPLKAEPILELRPEVAQAISTGMATEMSDRPSSISEWLTLLPANDPPTPANGHPSLERTESAKANLAVDSTRTDLTELDPTLAVLEPPQPILKQPAPRQTPRREAQITRPPSSRKTQRGSLAPSSRPTHFPRKALLLSAIASGMGGVGFGFFLKTQVLSTLLLPGSLSTLAFPGNAQEANPKLIPGTFQETIQETFPPKAGSQGYSTPRESQAPSIEPTLGEPDSAETVQSVPEASTYYPEAADATPRYADEALPPSTPQSALPRASSKPSTRTAPAPSSDTLGNAAPIDPQSHLADPSFEINAPANLEPMPPPVEAETFPGEEALTPSQNPAEPTLP
jgi:serine/threonine protein kinase